jgi:hypothetical protein
MDNIIDAKAVFAAKQLQSTVQRDVDSSKFTVQVEYDIINNQKYNWHNLEFKLVDNKTGKKHEIPVTSMFGN